MGDARSSQVTQRTVMSRHSSYVIGVLEPGLQGIYRNCCHVTEPLVDSPRKQTDRNGTGIDYRGRVYRISVTVV